MSINFVPQLSNFTTESTDFIPELTKELEKRKRFFSIIKRSVYYTEKITVNEYVSNNLSRLFYNEGYSIIDRRVEIYNSLEEHLNKSTAEILKEGNDCTDLPDLPAQLKALAVLLSNIIASDFLKEQDEKELCLSLGISVGDTLAALAKFFLGRKKVVTKVVPIDYMSGI